MNEKIKKQLEDIYINACIFLTQDKHINITIIIQKDEFLIPLIYPSKEDLPSDITKEQLQKEYVEFGKELAKEYKADGLIIIMEEYILKTSKNDELLKYIKNKQIKVSEHPDSKLYLSLKYNKKGSEKIHSLSGLIEKDLSGTPFVSEQKWIERENILEIDNFSTNSFFHI